MNLTCKCCCIAVIAFLANAPLVAQQAHIPVQQEVSRLHQWLGTDDNARNWRTYLHSSEIDQQLGFGSRADAGAVARVLAIYTNLPGSLRRAEFTAVEQALSAWVNELAQQAPDQLPIAARSAKEAFRPVSDQEVEQAKLNALEELRTLDQFLATGDANNRADWHKYLQWTELTSELGKPVPDASALDSIRRRFNRNERGLELSWFRRVAKSLENLRRISKAPSISRDQFSDNLDKLAVALEKFRSSPTSENGSVVAELLGWLESARQAPQLVALIRQRYSHPNIYAQASANLLNAATSDSLEQSQQIHSSFMGTDIHGIALTRGQLGLGLIPDINRAVIELRMQGTTNTTNTGYHGRVTIFSSGVTSIDARKRLELNESGIVGFPASAHCETNSSIDGVAARCRLVRKIADRKANESKGGAEAWASETAERQVSRQMDEKSAEMLQQANQSFREKFRDPLVRFNVYPQMLQFHTSSESLAITGLRADTAQLGAPHSLVPELLTPRSTQSDLSLQIHETFVGNLSESFLGGETLTDEKLEQLVKEVTGNVPEELKVREDKDPWSITFSADRPIGMEFRDGRIVITIRGRRFSQNNRDIRDAINISAAYRIDSSDGRTRLLRDGDVNVDYVNRDRLGVTQVTFKTFLRKKFEAMFKPEFLSEGFSPKQGRWQKLGTFFVSKARSETGWLSVAWNRGVTGSTSSTTGVTRPVSSGRLALNQTNHEARR